MATITPSYTDIVDTSGGLGGTIGKKVVWATMLNTDVGLPIPKNLGLFVDRTFQVAGTFGGGSVAIEGANNDDGTGGVGGFIALTDPQGVAIAITTAGIKQVTEAVINMRPHVTAGDGTTSLTVTAFLRRAVR